MLLGVFIGTVPDELWNIFETGEKISSVGIILISLI